MTLIACLLLLAIGVDDSALSHRPFAIEVVDEATGRGVPLVELETVNNIKLYTDSNGLAAMDEPGLMGQKVFFYVRSHGYAFARDGFGFAGQAIELTEGGSITLKIKRINIAERLYRVTGEGIYRDSVILGRSVPTKYPVLNGRVFGSDSVVNALFQGKLYWFWGDTNRPDYPLGNFHVPGATSLLPSKGGLDPERGVDLTYFVDEKTGFAKPTCPMPGEGPTWIGGLINLHDSSGNEHLLAGYVKIRPPMEAYEHGLVEFNPSSSQFEKVVKFPEKAPFYPTGQAFLREEIGGSFVYFATPYPLTRVRADVEAMKDLSQYQAYTPLKPGSKLDAPAIDRDELGTVRYGWKENTPPLGPQDQAKLIKAGQLKADEGLVQLQDVETGKNVLAHAGSVSWNAYRKRWLMVTAEIFGTSLLGEIWLAEADTPLGPWVYARKVVTHDKYSFYNPRQHPLLDQEGGKIIYFEGTYTHSFSGNSVQTPRYDYNQIMYRLDLADPRLNLPVPVYVQSEAARPILFGRREHIEDAARLSGRRENTEKPERLPIAFFALRRRGEATIPITFAAGAGKGPMLIENASSDAATLFHALPADLESPPATTTPLFEFVPENDGQPRAYSTDPNWSAPRYHRAEKPLCRVWRSPIRLGFPLR